LDAAVFHVDNDDVWWDGSFSGYQPMIYREASLKVLEEGAIHIPALIAALRNDNQWAIAHVLLWEITHASVTVADEKRLTYRGLHVDMDKKFPYDIRDKKILTVFWEKWWSTEGQYKYMDLRK